MTQGILDPDTVDEFNRAIESTLQAMGGTLQRAKLFAALSKAQSQMEGASKDSVNPHFRSKYADLASCWDACRKPLTDNGLTILQPVKAAGPEVTVTTILAHNSGEWMSESLTMTAGANTPQAIGSAITYGRRYGLCAMVGIAPEDDDGNEATRTPASSTVRGGEERENVGPAAGDSRPPTSDSTVRMPDGLSAEGLPAGQCYISKVAPGMGTAKFFIGTTAQGPTDAGLAYYEKDLSFTIVKGWCESGTAVKVETKESATGKLYLKKITPMPTTDTVL